MPVSFETLQPWLESSAFKTLLLVALVLLLRTLAAQTVRGWEFTSPEDKRRWLAAIRNVAIVLVTAGTVLIWAQELQSILISVVAIAAAIVIATKELIMCLSGALLRTATKAFHIGDRIEINGIRGDVIDHSPLGTVLLEIGPGTMSHQATGRAVVIPNSLLLTHPLYNETLDDQYVLHTFTVAIPRDADWKDAEQRLLFAAHAASAPYVEQAREAMDKAAVRHALEPIDPAPRVSLRLSDPQRIELLVRMPVPARRRGRTEQAVLRAFLEGKA